jgi:hypothetical protein
VGRYGNSPKLNNDGDDVDARLREFLGLSVVVVVVFALPT